MKNKYYDLIDQTFNFPQDEFRTEDGELMERIIQKAPVSEDSAGEGIQMNLFDD